MPKSSDWIRHTAWDTATKTQVLKESIKFHQTNAVF